MSEPKVTIKPSDQVVNQAHKEISVTDGNGRVISLKKPAVLTQYRLIEMLGDAARNQVYMGMVVPLIYVSAIDGEPVFVPTTKRELEALIQRLDEEGIEAVMMGVQENFGNIDPEKDKADLKN
jgi:hypothetical protein